jgi:hypothetical protein
VTGVQTCALPIYAFLRSEQSGQDHGCKFRRAGEYQLHGVARSQQRNRADERQRRSGIDTLLFLQFLADSLALEL